MGGDEAIMSFRLDSRSGLSPYRQLFDQVAAACRRGVLRPGDRLPSVREVVAQVRVNPNTVHRAYRELEAAGLAEARQGLGTFVAAVAVGAGPGPEERAELFSDLEAWIDRGRRAGLDPSAMRELFTGAMAGSRDEEASLT